MERINLNLDEVRKSEVRQSIKDLVRIYEVSEENVNTFVSNFSKKYRIPGYQKEFLQIARDEIRKIEAERTETGQE